MNDAFEAWWQKFTRDNPGHPADPQWKGIFRLVWDSAITVANEVAQNVGHDAVKATEGGESIWGIHRKIAEAIDELKSDKVSV